MLHFKGTQFSEIIGNFNTGGIYAQASTLTFDGTIIFEGNQGRDGGAMAFYALSLMDIRPNTLVEIINNQAITLGGGLYVDEGEEYELLLGSFQQITCFFQPSVRHLQQSHAHGNVVFRNNTAGVAGSELYGGWGDICISRIPSLNWNEVGEEYFNAAFHFSPNHTDLSQISSNPGRVCICTGEPLLPNCSITTYNTTSYPGSTITIFAVAVGQRFGIVPGIVRVSVSDKSIKIPTLQKFQSTERQCTMLSYTIASQNSVETLDLAPDNVPVFSDLEAKLSRLFGIHNNDLILSLFATMKVGVVLLPCPLGFTFNLAYNICDCNERLKDHSINCSIDIQSIYRRAPLWIYGQENGVIVHEHCPFDYCKSESLDLNLEFSDDQCDLHHSGILCGGCKSGYSRVLGSSVCKRCSSWWLLMIFPFVITGVALVVLLIFLNMTVTVGTVNGLLFYVNIIQANKAVFFQSKGSATALVVSWLNLDVGIEMCFFDGLDGYITTWLQLLFPFYIWSIVITIIVSSHYSTRAAKLFGRNAVSVLATLFLFSYTKMLRVFTTSLSFTTLEYPNGQRHYVWLYDGNVLYLQGKQIALFVVVLLVTITLTVPYTVFLLFAHVFQAKSNYVIFRFWVPRLLPLIDAHTGPYQTKHRHWTGVLLLLRVALIFVFSANILGDPAINLLAIIIATVALFVYLILFGSMYKNPQLTKLEYMFHTNLLLTTAVTLYARFATGNPDIAIHILVAIALVTFTAIVCYHLFVIVNKSPTWARLKKLRPVSQLPVRENTELAEASNTPQVRSKHTVTTIDNVKRFAELRDPLDLITDH